MWPFPVCGMRTKELHFLSMLLPSLSIFLSLFICPFSFQSVLLPFFHLLDLMIYFARTSDLCSTEVLSVTSKERSMSIISVVDSDKDKIRLDISPLSLAVLLIIQLISFQAASWIYVLDNHLTWSRKVLSFRNKMNVTCSHNFQIH